MKPLPLSPLDTANEVVNRYLGGGASPGEAFRALLNVCAWQQLQIRELELQIERPDDPGSTEGEL